MKKASNNIQFLFMCKTLANNNYECNGTCPPGTVWGSVVYTADSNIWTAAKHMGYLPGAFRKVDAPGLSAYIGTTQNGVTTANYGNYATSYYLIGTVSNYNNQPIDNQFKASIDKKLDSLPKIEEHLANLIKVHQKTLFEMQAKIKQRETEFLQMQEQLILQIADIKKKDEKSDQKSNFQKDLLLGMKQVYFSQMKNFKKNLSDLVNPKNILCTICLSNKRQALVLPCNHAHYCKQCLKKCLAQGKCQVCEGEIGGYMVINM